MPLLTSKYYVVNSLPLFSSVSKLSKKLAFTPFVKVMSERVAELAPESIAKFEDPHTGEGVSRDTIEAMRSAIQGKKDSAELECAALKHIEELLHGVSGQVGERTKLFAWVRHVITQANTRAIYGPLNPFQQPGVEDAFW